MKAGRIAVATGIVCSSAVVAFILVQGTVSDRPVGTHIAVPTLSRPGTTPCALQSQSLLTVGDLPGFKSQVDGGMGLPPISTHAGVPPSQLPPAYRTFVAGHLAGFVISKAYDQPYIALSQAHQRQMGYPVTETPELPLQGQIVQDLPGVLEAYQLNTVYSSPAGAANFQLNQTYGYTDPLDSRVTLPPPLSLATAFFIRPPAPGYEYRYQVDLVLGLIQVDFQFRGGNAMSVDTVAGLASHAVQRLMTACHLAFHS